MADHQSPSAGSSHLLEATRVTGSGRNVVIEILDDSDTPVEEIDQERGAGTQPAASASSEPNPSSQDEALQHELADIEADYASFRAEAAEHKAMETELIARRGELHAQHDELIARKRKLEADSAEYRAMLAEFKTIRDEYNVKHFELEVDWSDLEARHASYTRRREIALLHAQSSQSQSQNGADPLENVQNGCQPVLHTQANPEGSAQRTLSSRLSTPQLEQIRAEVRGILDNPGEVLEELNDALGFPAKSTIAPGGLDEDAPAPNLDADGDTEMSLAPIPTSHEPQEPKKFNMPFREESASSTEYVPKTAKSAKRKPTKPRRPTQDERDYEMMDDVYKRPWTGE